MSREKQIEEMAKDLVRYILHAKTYDKNAFEIAETLYEKGYRKQDEAFSWSHENGGEWEDANDGKYANPIYRCSVCQKGTLLKPDINELGNMSMIQALSPFCPHCGAKMKGGAE